MVRVLWLFSLGITVYGLFEKDDHSKYQPLGRDIAHPDRDYNELIKYAYLSSVAYCAYQGLMKGLIGAQNTTCPSKVCTHEFIKGINIVRKFDFDNLLDVGNGFIGVDPILEMIYVGFKGTSSRIDWINNIDLIRTKYTPQVIQNPDFNVSGACCFGCRVHHGFASFIKKNGALVIQMIVKLKKKYPTFQIKLTGHSLGAALALLTGIELRLLGYDALVITLASPKVGNSQFAEFVNSLFDTNNVLKHIEKNKSFEMLNNGYIRMVHNKDLIPYLPPTNKYAHAGYEYYLSVEGVKQTPMTIFRRGIHYLVNEKFDLWEMVKKFQRIDHSSYFMAITHCSHI